MIDLSRPEAARAVRAAATRSGWSPRSGTLSQRRGGFVCHVYDFAGGLHFKAKPVAWDNIVWRTLGLKFKRTPAPTRHYWGVACPSPILESLPIQASNIDTAAREALDFGEWALGEWPEDRVRQSSFMARNPPDRDADFVITETVALIEAGRIHEAREIARAVVTGERKCSCLVGAASPGARSQNFFEAFLEVANEPAGTPA